MRRREARHSVDESATILLTHLHKIREDIRSEIRTRIQQRDGYSIQLIVVLGAVFAAAFAQRGLDKVLIVAPLASIYFTMLILYSYRLHDVLARYLRTEIEPRTAQIVIDAAPGAAGSPSAWARELEWENWYVSRARLRPGLRRSFFYWIAVATTIGAMTYLWIVHGGESPFRVVLVVSSCTYALSILLTPIVFRREIEPFRHATAAS
jgi:hypothetical protein